MAAEHAAEANVDEYVTGPPRVNRRDESQLMTMHYLKFLRNLQARREVGGACRTRNGRNVEIQSPNGVSLAPVFSYGYRYR